MRCSTEGWNYKWGGDECPGQLYPALFTHSMSAEELMDIQINARLDELRKLRDVLTDLGSGLSNSQLGYLRRRMQELVSSKPGVQT